jgi:hypothetical protein
MKNEEIDKSNNEEIADQVRNDVTVEELSYIRLEELKIGIDNLKINLNNELSNKMRKIKMSELNLYGVENLKSVAVALTKLVDAGIKSYSDDGKITWGDIGHFIKVIPSIITAIPCVKFVKPEITDKLTEDEILELRLAITDNVELKNELDTEFLSQVIELLALISKIVTNRTVRIKGSDDKQ